MSQIEESQSVTGEDFDGWDDNPPSEIVNVPQSSEEIDLDKSEPASILDGYNPNLSYLENVLAGKSDAFAGKIIPFLIENEIDPEDPVFLLLLASGELELMLINTPYQVEEVLEQFADQQGQLFQQYFGATEAEAKSRFNAALTEEKAEIAAAARELIQATKREQFEGNLLTMAKMFAPALGVIATSIAIGVIGTLQYSKLATQSLIGAGQLTPAQYEALQWASSAEGKMGRQIMDLNKGYVGKTCKQDAEAMGLKLQVGGRKVTSGFCTLFVDPPNKRKYELL